MEFHFVRRGHDAIVELPTKQAAREILRIAKRMAADHPELADLYQEILEIAQRIERTKPLTILKNVY